MRNVNTATFIKNKLLISVCSHSFGLTSAFARHIARIVTIQVYYRRTLTIRYVLATTDDYLLRIARVVVRHR